MEYLIGIDGGGSRTRAWLAQTDGTVAGRGAAAGSNVHQLGVEAAVRTILEAVEAAWKQAGIAHNLRHGLGAVFAGVAGAGGRDDQSALAALLAQRLSLDPARCQVDHDLRIALAGALGGAPGAVLVAGTGSACYGRTTDGRTWKAGGWGPVLDDGGSGHWLGIQAMRALVRAADGREVPATFERSVLSHLEVSSPREILHRIRGEAAGGLDRASIAAVAPLVIAAASSGDPVAQRIVMRGAEELALMAAAVLDRLGFTADAAARIAGAGGLLESQSFYLEAVNRALAQKIPGVHLARADLPPVAGAVLLALELSGREAEPGVCARLLAAADSGANA